MILTKEHQEAMVANYAKYGASTESITGFIDGMNAIVELLNKTDNKSSEHGPVKGEYYWVKSFKDSNYEVAKCKERYGTGNKLHFGFTDGSVMDIHNVIDYKLISRL